MGVIEVSDQVKKFFSEHIVPVHKVVSITPTDNGWELEIEVIEEKEYMVSHAKDEMIGVYKVIVNQVLEIASFTRTQLRSRSSFE